ncbi:hypothetical protein [Paenibacillus sp. FSL M7-1046]|uniref:hypothetical protein n=1 Tax=Paenibacillus sp. FSL M7-1046 TaxID=2975315 RepID=UPI0030FBC260
MKKNISVALILAILLISLSACAKNTPTKYVDANGKEYTYSLELSGTMPNAEKSSKWVIYTNDADLTFDEAAKSILSSNSNDWIDMHIVSME